MPTTTFFNLPEGKRHKLLSAARAEFRRVPYEDASINQIIRGAEISRGSFYMYFEDKDDLFQYLLQEHFRQISAAMLRILEEERGNLFDAFLSAYDKIQSCLSDSREMPLTDLLAIMHMNAKLHPGLLMNVLDMAQVRTELAARTDTSRLNLQREKDLEQIIQAPIQITASATMLCGCTAPPEQRRSDYINLLSILRRGMER